MIAFFAVASAAECTLTEDGVPTTRIDCSSTAARRVQCPVPDRRTRLRIRLEVPERGLVAEARLPLSVAGPVDLPVMGPGGRAGVFLVDEASPGLLPGQALGPMQLCSSLQPGVLGGAPRVEEPFRVVLTAHVQTGTAEEILDGGLIQRVPVFDEGHEVASVDAVIVQRPVEEAPIAVPPVGPVTDEIEGAIQVFRDEAWRPLAYTGTLGTVPTDGGPLTVLSVDFEALELEDALGPGGAEALVEADLMSWLTGGSDSLLGLAAWRRSKLFAPVSAAVDFGDHRLDRTSWRRAQLPRAEVWIGRHGDRIRVAIGHRLTPIDADAASAFADRIREGLGLR